MDFVVLLAKDEALLDSRMRLQDGLDLGRSDMVVTVPTKVMDLNFLISVSYFLLDQLFHPIDIEQAAFLIVKSEVAGAAVAVLGEEVLGGLRPRQVLQHHAGRLQAQLALLVGLADLAGVGVDHLDGGPRDDRAQVAVLLAHRHHAGLGLAVAVVHVLQAGEHLPQLDLANRGNG